MIVKPVSSSHFAKTASSLLLSSKVSSTTPIEEDMPADIRSFFGPRGGQVSIKEQTAEKVPVRTSYSRATPY